MPMRIPRKPADLPVAEKGENVLLRSELMRAAAAADLDGARRLLVDPDTDVSETDPLGCTALHDDIAPGLRRGRTPGCALRAAGRFQDRADLHRGGDGREPRDATRYHQLRTSAGAGGHQSRAGARAARPRQLQLARQPITADAPFHNIHCRRRLWLLRVVRRRS